jgi:hypothetical protein
MRADDGQESGFCSGSGDDLEGRVAQQRVALNEHQGSSESPRRVTVLNPVEPGDLSAVKVWAELKMLRQDHRAAV